MISDVYRQLLIDKLVKSKFEYKEDSSAEEVAAHINNELENSDLSVPQFRADRFSVVRKENSSAGKFNLTFDTLRQDLDVLYKSLFNITEVSINSVERWKTESYSIEKRLQVLEDRIDNLLLLAQDTEGYNSFIVDNFDDFRYVDTANTTVQVDTAASQAYIKSSNSSLSRIFLNHLTEDSIRFKVRSNGTIVEDSNNPRSNIFNQNTNDFWLGTVTTAKEESVVCDLIIKLGNSPIPLTSIYLYLHDPVQCGPLSITPLYSIDDYSYFQLPTKTFTQEMKTTGVFNFSTIKAKYLKFVLVKSGSDSKDDNGFHYRFGFNEIALYNESFDTSVTQQLITTSLSVVDSDSNPVGFSHLALEACERIETNTDIKYFLTASHDSDVPITTETKWFEIASSNRYVASVPQVLDIGDLEEREYGIDEDVLVSYEAQAASSDYVNPAQSFHLLSDTGSDAITDEMVVADDIRYIFNSDSEAILNYQIKDSDYIGSGTGTSVDIDEDSLVVFRNVGEKGLDEEASASYVRSIMRGWRFEDPYYITVVEITNPYGLSIDVGSGFIIIDGARYTGKVDSSILYGKTESTDGIHEVKIYRDYWKIITPGVNTLTELKNLDSLYPYNQKLLIEGYSYGSDYPSDQEYLYIGVDLFAAYKMKKLNIFDFAKNISNKDYQYYALDRDAPDAHTDGNEATRVFVVKIDHNNADLQFEHFVIRFNQINQRFEYFKLRADFTTSNAGVTPSLDGWKLRLG
jgi:hypothetical protein